MPRVMVTSDSGEMYWTESVKAVDFETEHFRSGLSSRLGWAVADAEGPAPTRTDRIRPQPSPEPTRILPEAAGLQRLAA